MTTTSRGFTLVETLVAITIVALAIVGPLYAVQQGLNASRSARDQLIAASLAQEGLEFVRNIRDENYLYNLANPASPRAWLSGLDGNAGSENCFTNDCVIDATQRTVSDTVLPLYLSASGLYNQAGSGNATPYTRTVRLTTISATEVRVTVTMSWRTRNVPYTTTVSEILNNWL